MCSDTYYYSKLLMLAGVLLIAVLAWSHGHAAEEPSPDPDFVKRDFNPVLDGQWIGNGISYGAYRDGESPVDKAQKYWGEIGRARWRERV